MYREFIIFVSILAAANCQICCFNCYCPLPAATVPGGGSTSIYIILPRYGFGGLGGLGSLTGGFGGLGTSYGPAVNGLCPIGVNIGGQCYALGG